MKNKQSGAVLAVCLVMLLVLTLIGIASMSNSTLQERMAGGSRDYNMAFQAAETALREGEEYIRAQAAASVDPATLFNTVPTGDSGFVALTAAEWAPPEDVSADISQPEFRPRNYYAGSGASNQFICETDGSVAVGNDLICLTRTYLFDIEARGYGSGDLVVELQSTVAIAINQL